jgi:beta-glucanase (GH16 family)
MKLILAGKSTLACFSLAIALTTVVSCKKESTLSSLKPQSPAQAQAGAVAALTYQLVWSDEFNGTSVNTGNWNFETGAGGWGNNEQQYYRSQNATVSNGNLVITARRESFGGANYTSARLTTQNKRQYTYGRMEARLRLPLGQGLWPAFWMLGSNISSVGWPRCGEIDIMEHINTSNTVYGTIHWDANGYAQYGGNTNTTPASYHVYSIEWNSSSIKWFVDGVKYHEANILNNINSTEEFHRPFFFILNLAVGGNWPGQTIDNSKLPASMYVDYVRVYQLR